jgi:iron(II)-dependent oxidoreductase
MPKLPPGLQKGRAPDEFINIRDRAVMVFVPAGNCELGTDDKDEDEAPRHRVALMAFFIDSHEVTNARYAKFLAWWREAPKDSQRAFRHRDEPPGHDHTPAFWPRKDEKKGGTTAKGREADPPVPEHPVVGVSWFSAWAYAQWASLSLPTEAQWEKAAGYDPKTKRARKFPWGAQKPEFTMLNFGRNVLQPTRTGIYTAGGSPLGCFDMAGNVWEWCLDFYHKDFYKTKAGTGQDPVNVFPSPFRVTKGGSYNSEETECRVSYRDRSRPDSRFSDLGFRCVKNYPFRKASKK